jgi:hypothetical protein
MRSKGNLSFRERIFESVRNKDDKLPGADDRYLAEALMKRGKWESFIPRNQAFVAVCLD